MIEEYTITRRQFKKGLLKAIEEAEVKGLSPSTANELRRLKNRTKGFLIKEFENQGWKCPLTQAGGISIRPVSPAEWAFIHTFDNHFITFTKAGSWNYHRTARFKVIDPWYSPRRSLTTR
jgi:hypothetical protein